MHNLRIGIWSTFFGVFVLDGKPSNGNVLKLISDPDFGVLVFQTVEYLNTMDAVNSPKIVVNIFYIKLEEQFI